MKAENRIYFQLNKNMLIILNFSQFSCYVDNQKLGLENKNRNTALYIQIYAS